MISKDSTKISGAVYHYNVPTEETYIHFKEGSWYKGLNQDRGIIAKRSSSYDRNNGWWSGYFCQQYFCLITPENWEEITDTVMIRELEEKLKIELEKRS